MGLLSIARYRAELLFYSHTHPHTSIPILPLSFLPSFFLPLSPSPPLSHATPRVVGRAPVPCGSRHCAPSCGARYFECRDSDEHREPILTVWGFHCAPHSYIRLTLSPSFSFPSFFFTCPLSFLCSFPSGSPVFAVLTRSHHPFASRRCVCALLMILLKFVTTTDSPCGW